MPPRVANQYFTFQDSSMIPQKSRHTPNIRGQQLNPKSKLNAGSPPSLLTQLLHRPLSTIFKTRLAVLLIALWATLTSIRDHAGMLSDAVALGCFLNEYISVPTGVSRFCNNSQETDSCIIILSDRVHKVEDEVAALRATQSLDPKIPQRNFALRGGGATINATITSPTYQLPARTTKSRFLQWFRGHDLQDAHINLPIVALEDIVEVGECWEFGGGYGTIGIHLSEGIHLSSFSLNYIQPSKISTTSMARAPRNVTLWGNIDQATSHPESRTFDHQPFIPLIHAEYNISGQSLLQNFPLTNDSIGKIPYRTVVLEITSNWGASTTCLYYIGVHGMNPEEH